MDGYYDDMTDYEVMQDVMEASYHDLKPKSLSSLLTSDNDVVFDLLDSQIKTGKTLALSCGIESKMAFYSFITDNEDKRKLYLNKEIVLYVTNYLVNGEKGTKMPNVYQIDEEVDETYILRLIKFDRQNRATHYTQSTQEYKAIYTHGTINYGKLPYTTEEMIAKLNTL